MLASVKDYIEGDMPVYAECGGLMYMCQSIVDLEGKSYEMVGVIENTSTMTGRLKRFGYVEASLNEDTIIGKSGTAFRAHEFHRSELSVCDDDHMQYDVEKDRGNGDVKRWNCGYSYKNFLGGYAHIHFYNNLELPVNFLKTCQRIKEQKNG
jgi:cobyrinic acid a,c-diamide synthase